MDSVTPSDDPCRPMDSRALPAVDATGRIPTRFIDHLSDEDLRTLNGLLPWRCFTLDANGREFGVRATDTKRNTPQQIPDRRIVELDRRYPLAGKSVLEIGCFEGIHSIALAHRAREVIAIDSRIENIVKTIVRTWSFGLHVTSFVCDVEKPEQFALVPEVDVTHHVGVLYHLVDPIGHLARLLPKTREMLMLDTHVAAEGTAKESYEVAGRKYPYRRYDEQGARSKQSAGGRTAVFSGMYDHAKWLPLDVLTSALRDFGFGDVDVAEHRDERNGPRVLIYARRR